MTTLDLCFKLYCKIIQLGYKWRDGRKECEYLHWGQYPRNDATCQPNVYIFV